MVDQSGAVVSEQSSRTEADVEPLPRREGPRLGGMIWMDVAADGGRSENGDHQNALARELMAHHDTEMNLLTIPTFASDGVFHVVVESPRGSAMKLKYEPRWQAMSISRPLTLGITYPFDWGFVPSTSGPDGDAIDALVLWDIASFPGVVLPCRALGVLRVEQNRTNHDPSVRLRNDRVVSIPVAARREGDIASVDALPRRVREECEQFALVATALEGKDVRILGWDGPASALSLLHAAQADGHR